MIRACKVRCPVPKLIAAHQRQFVRLVEDGEHSPPTCSALAATLPTASQSCPAKRPTKFAENESLAECARHDGLVSILRSRRLESVFGVQLEAVAAEDIHSLVSNGVAESFDLDFKQTLYGRGDSDKRALAGDVAALANTAGGVIVVGVAEDDQARATAADGVDLSDAEKARMLQVIASGVSPMPAVEILAVPVGQTPPPDDGNSELGERGYFLIAVPRSLAAPHAVLVNDGFRFPKRNGSTTRICRSLNWLRPTAIGSAESHPRASRSSGWSTNCAGTWRRCTCRG